MVYRWRIVTPHIPWIKNILNLIVWTRCFFFRYMASRKNRIGYLNEAYFKWVGARAGIDSMVVLCFMYCEKKHWLRWYRIRGESIRCIIGAAPGGFSDNPHIDHLFVWGLLSWEVDPPNPAKGVYTLIPSGACSWLALLSNAVCNWYRRYRIYMVRTSEDPKVFSECIPSWLSAIVQLDQFWWASTHIPSGCTVRMTGRSMAWNYGILIAGNSHLVIPPIAIRTNLTGSVSSYLCFQAVFCQLTISIMDGWTKIDYRDTVKVLYIGTPPGYRLLEKRRKEISSGCNPGHTLLSGALRMWH